MENNIEIKNLQRKLKLKEEEVLSLYNLIDKLNLNVNELINSLEEGVGQANTVNRKFSTKKFPNVDEISFASKYLMSMSSNSSYFDFFTLNEKKGIGFILSDSSGYNISSYIIDLIVKEIERKKKIFKTDTFLNNLEEKLKKYIEQNKIKKSSDFNLLSLKINKKSLNLNYSTLGNQKFFILRGKEKKLFKVKNIKDENYKLNPGDKILILNNYFEKTLDLEKKEEENKYLERILSNSSYLPISDIISNLGFYIDQKIKGDRKKLFGDISIIGIEIQTNMLYVI
jgi:serine phosphatase RsbU (regulator of sigma subunit)